MSISLLKSLILVSAFSALAACGGGGSSGNGNNGGNDSGNNGNGSGGSPEPETRDIGLYFNEVMREVRLNKSADNQDEDNTAQPWLELFNSTSVAIDLSGKSLSVKGDNTQTWELPEQLLEAGGFLRIWGSGKDRQNGSHGPHAGFSLLGAESLFLLDTDGAVLDSLSEIIIPADKAMARYPDGENWSRFSENPTPGENNSNSGDQLAANCQDVSITAGKTFQARVMPDVSVSWSSDNSRITVNNNGLISAGSDIYGPGATATLTAKDGNGNSTRCEVTIVGWTANRSSLKIVGTPEADFLLDYIDDTAYFTYPGKLMASTDGMQSATQVGTFPPTPSSPAMKKTPYGYFASSGNAIYSSADFNSWKIELQMRHRTLQHGFSHYFDKNNNIAHVYAGEYSVGNDDVHSVYRGSTNGDGNVTWEEILYWGSLTDFYNNNSNLDTIRHVHLVVTDPYTGHVWVGTGDADQHSRLYYSEDNGESFTLVGIGSQKFRSLSIWFTENYVYWNMDTEMAPQHIYRLPRSVYNKNGRWPSLTPELSRGSTKPGVRYLVTASTGGRFPTGTGGIYTENTARTIDSSNRVRPIEDTGYDYSDKVAELTHASHWYHLWVKDQNGDDVLIMNTSAEGNEPFRRDFKSRTFGFKENKDGRVDVQELLSMPSDTPDELNIYTQLIPHMQDKEGYIYFQGRNTAHRIYKMRLNWVDQ